MAVRAVLTGDIVHSTRLLPAVEKNLLKNLQRELKVYVFEFYRGDSFQAYLPHPGDGLQTALRCRALAKSILSADKSYSPDVRISIGIGAAKMPPANLGTANGEAFILSGRAFDRMEQENSRLMISSANGLAHAGLQVIGDYINAIFDHMTSKQAAVILELLKGNNQQTVAAKLKKSRSTISQHASAGRWPEIEKLIQHYQTIVNQLT